MKLVVLSGVIGTLLSLLGTPMVISFLRKRGYAQAIRESAGGINYPEHAGKRGTPSMGGLAVIIAVLGGYYGTHVIMWTPPTASGNLAVLLMVTLGVVGMSDDYLKIFKQRSTGIRARTKLLGQTGAALGFAILGLQFPDSNGQTPIALHVSWVRDTPWVLPSSAVILLVWFLVTGITNGVNLTDGLDGLAGWNLAVAFGAYGVITFLSGDFTNLMTLSFTLVGACVAFLWYNAHPAEVFMGDVGSLALGGAIATVAILIKQELLLVIVGGVFVIEAASVVIQVASFKLRGKRVFKMSPLHHHFELSGWAEPKVITRFLIVAIIFALFSLTTLKLR